VRILKADFGWYQWGHLTVLNANLDDKKTSDYDGANRELSRCACHGTSTLIVRKVMRATGIGWSLNNESGIELTLKLQMD
jgi:hypothetical protein